jgi:RNA polymerase sigma-70 factor (ECF subfamily)
MTDEEIIGHVRNGDTRPFAELVCRYQDAVYGMALRFTGAPGDAEDVAQEAFLKAYRSLSAFKGEAKFSTWLDRIAYNLCVDWLRKNRRPDRRVSSMDESAEPSDGRVDIEAGVIASEETERVRAALAELDEKYRGPIEMLYYQKMSYGEIAAVLEIPEKTVETRLYRARKLLRERLEHP